MLNRSASLAMSTSILKALPSKLDIKRHSPSILYLTFQARILIKAGSNMNKQKKKKNNTEYDYDTTTIQMGLKKSI